MGPLTASIGLLPSAMSHWVNITTPFSGDPGQKGENVVVDTIDKIGIVLQGTAVAKGEYRNGSLPLGNAGRGYGFRRFHFTFSLDALRSQLKSAGKKQCKRKAHNTDVEHDTI